MNDKLFSLPINPTLSEEDFNEIIKPFIEDNKDFIYDFYATIRISPFDGDAMFGSEKSLSNDELIEQALMYQNLFDIPVTATFNDKFISPSLVNRELWIKNFKPLYEKGIKRVILPFQHWLLDGRIRREFPEIFIKNTILNMIKDPQDVYASAQFFDFIYIDRNIMRDLDGLEMLLKVKKKVKKDFGKDIILSLLLNEGCKGKCPVQQEHYAFNAKKGDEEGAYFSNPISQYTCPMWQAQDPAYLLKVSDLIPLKSEFDRMRKYFDVFKLHGRSSPELLEDSLIMIDNYRNGRDPDPEKVEYFRENLKDFDKYLKDIENCKFQCWNCSKCDHNLKPMNMGFDPLGEIYAN